VLENGRDTQLGTHEQLAEQEGLYKQLWQIQTALEEDLSRELGSAGADEDKNELIIQK
jgi:ATP-binding cassette subfamily B protein